MKTKNAIYLTALFIGLVMFIGMSIYCLYILSIKDILALFIAFILLISITKKQTNETRN
jgi:hypothetical protein